MAKNWMLTLVSLSVRRRRIPNSYYYSSSCFSVLRSFTNFTSQQRGLNGHSCNSIKSVAFVAPCKNQQRYFFNSNRLHKIDVRGITRSHALIDFVSPGVPAKIPRTDEKVHQFSTTNDNTDGAEALNNLHHKHDVDDNDGNTYNDESTTDETSKGTDELITSEIMSTTSSNSVAAINDEWIPPNRPLMGDVGQAHLYTHIEEDKELRQLLSENDEEVDSTIQNKSSSVVEAEVVPPSMDWLKTRRTMLTGQSMMKPDDAALYKQSMVDIELPIIEHTLYTQQELVHFLEGIGGQNVEVILDQADTSKGGRRRLGKDVMGIILVTSSNYSQLQNMANQVVRQLRRRKLQEVNVVGAELGPDGNMDDPNENWYAIDCGNYVVHIQDVKTRTAVNLAGLWSGKDPIRKVDCTNDESIDDYISRYPVPQNYTVGGSLSASSTLLYDINNWDATMKQFEKSRWTRDHTTNMITAGSRNRFRNKPTVPKRKRKTSGRKT